MASTHKTITPECLSHLHDYWFKDCDVVSREEDGKHDEVPTPALKRWFMGGEEVDIYCKEHFKDAVEAAIRTPDEELEKLASSSSSSSSSTSSSLTSSQNALSLLLLLDQMPRNIYRGKEAKTAYTKCDPKAQVLAQKFISDPYNYDKRENCKSWYHQSFFYIPLMHSENPSHHEMINSKILSALEHPATTQGEKDAIKQTQGFEKDHFDVIKRFGRYPSRNEAMERESTKEEQEFLKNGPGWGAKQEK